MKPGPGIGKDEPPKKGFRRFLQIISLGGADLVKLNLLFVFAAAPAVAAFLMGLFGYFGAYMYIVSLVLTLPLGGVITACVFCITVMLRDEHLFIWHDFKRKFFENAKQAAVPGVLYAVFLYAQVLLIAMLISGMIYADVPIIITVTVMPLMFATVAPFVFVQLAYVNLKTPRIVINSLLLPLADFKRSIAGALMSLCPYAVFLLLMPASIPFAPVLLLIGFSLPWLLSLMWIWPAVDKRFAIAETLQKQVEC